MNTVGCVKREAERRFLLQRLPAALPDAQVFGIRQFYTARDPARYYAIRFRRIEDLHSGAVSCIETHKIGTGMDVMETEYPVVPSLYADIQRLYGIGREITKQRHVTRINGDTWEIDVYDGPYAGLVVAEIELDDPERPVQVPALFGPWLEVTAWRGMRNVVLSFDGLTDELRARLRDWYGRPIGDAS